MMLRNRHPRLDGGLPNACTAKWTRNVWWSDQVRPDGTDARVCFFKPDQQGRKEEIWTDAHFLHYPPLAQWRRH
jgi:hypothetical protein